MQSRSIVDLDLRLFYQTAQNQFNFPVLYITKLRQISSYDALEMMERLVWSSLGLRDFSLANRYDLVHLRKVCDMSLFFKINHEENLPTCGMMPGSLARNNRSKSVLWVFGTAVPKYRFFEPTYWMHKPLMFISIMFRKCYVKYLCVWKLTFFIFFIYRYLYILQVMNKHDDFYVSTVMENDITPRTWTPSPINYYNYIRRY